MISSAADKFFFCKENLPSIPSCAKLCGYYKQWHNSDRITLRLLYFVSSGVMKEARLMDPHNYKAIKIPPDYWMILGEIIGL